MKKFHSILGVLIVASASVHGATTFFSADTTTGHFDAPTDLAEYGTSFDNVSNENGLASSVASLTEANVLSTSHSLGFVSGNTVVRDGVGASTITVNFGFTTPEDLTEIYVWNYTQPVCCEDRGVNSYEVYIDTGSGFGGTADYTGNLVSATHTAGSHFAQQIDFGVPEAGVVGVRLVGLSNFGGNAIGLDEVVFGFDDTVIPEPTSGVLVLLSGLCLLKRRRS